MVSWGVYVIFVLYRQVTVVTGCTKCRLICCHMIGINNYEYYILLHPFPNFKRLNTYLIRTRWLRNCRQTTWDWLCGSCGRRRGFKRQMSDLIMWVSPLPTTGPWIRAIMIIMLLAEHAQSHLYITVHPVCVWAKWMSWADVATHQWQYSRMASLQAHSLRWLSVTLTLTLIHPYPHINFIHHTGTQHTLTLSKH